MAHLQHVPLTIKASDSKVYFYKRESDGTLTSLGTGSLLMSLTSGNWYEAKVVIDDDPGDRDLQRLRFSVDTDDDGDYGDEVTRITSTAVDDTWSAGQVGLYPLTREGPRSGWAGGPTGPLPTSRVKGTAAPADRRFNSTTT